MKNVISTAFVGALGGACVLIANHFLVNTAQPFTQQSNQQSAPVHYTSYTGSSSLAPDFVNAADKSLNALVHIKTVVESQANLAYDPFQE